MSMMADMSASLKVVSMAAVRCASSSRLAIVWRRRDMRIRVSPRCPSRGGSCGVGASGSPASTWSPSRFNQAPTVASTTDSPSVGTRTSTGMGWDSLEDLGDDAVLFGGMGFGPSLGRTGLLGPTDIAQVVTIAQVALDERPGAHVARLFLQPDHLAGLGVAFENVGYGVRREGVELL